MAAFVFRSPPTVGERLYLTSYISVVNVADWNAHERGGSMAIALHPSATGMLRALALTNHVHNSSVALS